MAGSQTSAIVGPSAEEYRQRVRLEGGELIDHGDSPAEGEVEVGRHHRHAEEPLAERLHHVR